MIDFTNYYGILESERVTIHDLVYYFNKGELDYDEHGNVFVGFNKENKGSPILVAHMDNVLKGAREPVLSLDGRFISGRKVGIGFDDKAGIIANIELYNRMKGKVRLIFTTDEEVGGVSAGKLDPSRYANARFMIELDRRGGNDLIQTSGCTRLCSDKFALMIEGYGFKRATGTFTDVNKFKAKCPKVEMCNLSIGYYSPHTDNEYLDTIEFNDIVDRVERILKECTDKYEDTQVDKPTTVTSTRYDWERNRYNDDDDWDGYFDEKKERYCENCGALIPKGQGVITKDGFLCCDDMCKEELESYFEEQVAK